MSPRPPILGRTRTPGSVSRESGEGPSSGSAEGSGERKGVGLSGALLAYAVAMTLTITLAPFRFEAPGRVNLLVVGGFGEAAANLVLFLPLGFLWRLTRPRQGDRFGLSALAAGLALSTAIEVTQVVVPGRYPALLDVLMNGSGAMLGALLHDAVRRRLGSGGQVVSRLALEQPLMVLLYMLVPLMWLNGLAVVEAPLATLRLVMLGFFGASILAAVQRRHLGPAGLLNRTGAALAAVGGYYAGAFPALLVRPVAVLVHGGIVALLCGYLASGKPNRNRPERRFERETLLRAAPFFAAYLLLLPLVTPDSALPGTAVNRTLILEIVQSLAATSMLGFMVAESRGRTARSYVDSVAWVVFWSAVAAAVTGWLASATGTGIMGIARLGLSLLAGLMGGWIYHLQRDRIVGEADARQSPVGGRP